MVLREGGYTSTDNNQQIMSFPAFFISVLWFFSLQLYYFGSVLLLLTVSQLIKSSDSGVGEDQSRTYKTVKNWTGGQKHDLKELLMMFCICWMWKQTIVY